MENIVMEKCLSWYLTSARVDITRAVSISYHLPQHRFAALCNMKFSALSIWNSQIVLYHDFAAFPLIYAVQ